MKSEISSLQKDLTKRVSIWQFPAGILAEDIISEAMVAYLRRTNAGEQIQQPIRWLLRTAKFKRLELSRQNQPMVPYTEETTSRPARIAPNGDLRVDLCQSDTWKALTMLQRFVIEETVMYGRPLTEVANEADVNRSTAKSWIKRIMPRLATDQYFLSLLN